MKLDQHPDDLADLMEGSADLEDKLDALLTASGLPKPCKPKAAANPHCARLKPCAAGCQYPQPCDSQTVPPPR